MKVLMTADARSVHTRRWAVSLKAEGVDIVLYSIFPSPDAFFEEHGIRLYVFDLFTYKQLKGIRSVISMISRHREAVRYLRSVIDSESPDILHAHYATSFGLIAALSGFHPFIISVWGSDVYEFPEKSFLNRESVKFIMRRADRILSTSHVMARRTALYTSKPVSVYSFWSRYLFIQEAFRKSCRRFCRRKCQDTFSQVRYRRSDTGFQDSHGAQSTAPYVSCHSR